MLPADIGVFFKHTAVIVFEVLFMVATSCLVAQAFGISARPESILTVDIWATSAGSGTHGLRVVDNGKQQQPLGGNALMC